MLKRISITAASVIIILSLFAGPARCNEEQEILDKCSKALETLKSINALMQAVDSIPIVMENSIHMDKGLNSLGWLGARRENGPQELVGEMEQQLVRNLAIIAEAQLKKATEQAGNNSAPYAWFMLGWVQYRYLNKYEESVANIQVAVEIEKEGGDRGDGPKEPSIHTMIGLVWATIALEKSKGGKYVLARQAIENLKELFDNYHEGKRVKGIESAYVSMLDLGYAIASMYAYIGDKDATLDVLRTLHFRIDYTRQKPEENQESNPYMDLTCAKFDPNFMFIYRDRDFEDLMKDVETKKLIFDKKRDKWDPQAEFEKFKEEVRKKNTGEPAKEEPKTEEEPKE